jgi:hypothetical protein
MMVMGGHKFIDSTYEEPRFLVAFAGAAKQWDGDKVAILSSGEPVASEEESKSQLLGPESLWCL